MLKSSPNRHQEHYLNRRKNNEIVAKCHQRGYVMIREYLQPLKSSSLTSSCHQRVHKNINIASKLPADVLRNDKQNKKEPCRNRHPNRHQKRYPNLHG